MENPQLKLGMIFSSPQVFKQALVEWTVRQGYDIKYLKNENKRIMAICKFDCGMHHPCRVRGHFKLRHSSQSIHVV